MGGYFPILLLSVATGLLLAGCATPVALPDTGALPEKRPVQQLERPQDSGSSAPQPMSAWKPLQAGERLVHGVVLDATLAQVLRLQAAGRLDQAIGLIDEKRPSVKDKALAWYLAVQRLHLLNLAGRASEAESGAAGVARLEIALRGSDLVARTLRGDARARLGDFEAAIADFETVLLALGHWRFPTRYGGPPSNILDLAVTAEARTRALLGLAFVHSMQGDHQSALLWAAEGERHLAAMFAVSADPLYGPYLGRMPQDAYLARAVNLAFIAAAHLALGHPDEQAASFFEAARQGFAAIGFAHGAVYIESLKALALLRAGRIAEAEQAAGRARKLADERGLVDFVWRVGVIEAEALLAAGRSDAAETVFRKAQDAVDRLSGAIRGDREKRRFGTGKDDITWRLAQFGFARRQADQLFRDLERGRARAFVDMLANVDVAADAGGAWPDLRRLDVRISALVRQLEGGSNPEVVPELHRELQGLLAERDRFVDHIRKSDPELAATRSVARFDLKQVQQALPAGVLLLYFLPSRGDENLRALAITRQDVEFLTYPVRLSGFNALMERLATAVDSQSPERQKMVAGDFARALMLDRWRGHFLVQVVPSGPLHAVPWGMLDVPAPVVVLPTGSWPLRHRQQDDGKRAVVVGDPDFSGRMPRLPGARAEALQVARHYDATLLLGKEASEIGLRRAVGAGVSLLHLATHGRFDARRPLDSAIYLQGGQPLTAKALFAAPLKAGTVVLSACETGAGKVVAGDDLLGLPRSFFLGGTGTVLSSLWPIDDEGTLAFMRHFHAERAAGVPVAHAWLNARDRLRREGWHPWVYGAFVLMGSG